MLDGAELVGAELRAAITHPRNLAGHEHEAWEQLGHWVDEAEVRSKDKNYATFHLDWLTDLHSKLAQ